jgi:hypothetical protein
MGERVHRYLRDALYSGETKKLTAAALRSRIRDLVVSSLDAVNLEAETRKLRAAAENPIPFGDSAEVVQRVAERFALDEEERRSVLRHFVEGNDFTQYGLHAAITRTSADVRDYDRATQLERIGGRVLGMVAFEWRTIPHALPLVPRAARRMVS